MIEVTGLTKSYGKTRAVDDLTFEVTAGQVTGLLGPHGAGKSTTLRLALGLDNPTAGKVLFDGKRYRELKHPLRTVGALLDARSTHPNRSARAHLAWMAKSNRVPAVRVDDVLEAVGLSTVAGDRAGGLSLGMARRLGFAAALLGDPEVLLLDEPMNGLAPEDILWARKFTRRLTDEGRTVVVSSHVISEVALAASRLVVIDAGKLVCQSSTEEFIAGTAEHGIKIKPPRQQPAPADTNTALTELTDSLVGFTGSVPGSDRRPPSPL
jgi:ABC-2 type transport system ATP-binding protein